MASAFRCDDCGFASFKTEQSFQAHLLTKKHRLRQENTREDLLQCKLCNKWFCGSSGLSHHKHTCKKSVREDPMPNSAPQPTTSTGDSQMVLQQQIKDMKDAFEKEKQNMKDELDAMKKEILEIYKRLAKEDPITKVAAITSPPVPTKRRKINKDLRQQIADKQENACGSCKLTLTPYFQIDHTVGLQFGGTDEESNLMALCCECHAMKSIAENQCRKQIHEAIQTILTDKLGQRG